MYLTGGLGLFARGNDNGSVQFNITEPLTPQEIEFFVPYHYIPTEWICVLFVVLFGLSTLIHLGQAIYFRLWWLFPTAILAGIGEVIGWSARLWSSQNPLLSTPFLMQISTTIIAPTPLVAANFIILGHLIRSLGDQYSQLRPNSYTIIFCSSDVIALVIQAVGGGLASTSSSNKDAETGGNIMLGGIVFQLVSITIYATLASEFFIRVSLDRPIVGRLRSNVSETTVGTGSQTKLGRAPITRRFRLMLIALGFSTLCIFIRSIYRTVELADGWNGRIISTQRYFDWLDGAMIVLAMYTLNIFHPGVLLAGVIGRKKSA